MPANVRPLLIMAYFDQPDVLVHFRDNEEVRLLLSTTSTLTNLRIFK